MCRLTAVDFDAERSCYGRGAAAAHNRFSFGAGFDRGVLTFIQNSLWAYLNPDGISLNRTPAFDDGSEVGGGGALRPIIEMAYDLRTFQIPGGPAWVDTDRYDISTKNSSAVSELGKEQRSLEMRRGLQTVPADRFRLKVHHEIQERPEYTMVVAKGGIRLKEPDPGMNNGISMERCGVMKGTRTTMSNLAIVLSRQVERPVLDRTGLDGIYDFEMSYTPDNGCSSGQSDSGSNNSAALTDRPSIFTALQEQLGLRLESVKGPVEVIVIDSVEKPEPN